MYGAVAPVKPWSVTITCVWHLFLLGALGVEAYVRVEQEAKKFSHGEMVERMDTSRRESYSLRTDDYNDGHPYS